MTTAQLAAKFEIGVSRVKQLNKELGLAPKPATRVPKRKASDVVQEAF